MNRPKKITPMTRQQSVRETKASEKGIKRPRNKTPEECKKEKMALRLTVPTSSQHHHRHPPHKPITLLSSPRPEATRWQQYLAESGHFEQETLQTPSLQVFIRLILRKSLPRVVVAGGEEKRRAARRSRLPLWSRPAPDARRTGLQRGRKAPLVSY
jgi:hypothetical protein